MTSDLEFTHWFTAVTTHKSSHPWQSDLADERTCRDRLIRIPTGLGKTEGVLAAWSFHRICQADDRWPRRLVWCLPMRVLVEQTEQVAQAIASRIPPERRPSVHVLMGGEDSGEWFLHPERPAILIGTQDMLLSRALNRGYASGRARWPIEFGLLNQDALWIMDEVQLMDVGLATSAQLQAFRGQDCLRGRSIRPCQTWWMSATLQPDWLKSVDTAEQHLEWVREPCLVPSEQHSGGLWEGEAFQLREHYSSLAPTVATQLQGDNRGAGGDSISAACALPLSQAIAIEQSPTVQKVLDCSADEFNLLAYLVASHHGKVRAGLHAAPKDQDYRDRDHRGLPIRGVREGDRLPGICLESAAAPLPELSLTLEPAALGLSTRTGVSWRERCDQLLAQYGPGGLAFLESLLRAADVRASRLKTNDPAFVKVESEVI